MAETLQTGTITTLGQLRPGDVGEWLDTGGRFLVTGKKSYTVVRYAEADCVGEGNEQVRYLGRGRIEPARIEMDGEPDAGPLVWTDAKPTVPGWYWWREESNEDTYFWQVVQVYARAYEPNKGALVVSPNDGASDFLERFHGQFAGPLPMPGEPK